MKKLFKVIMVLGTIAAVASLTACSGKSSEGKLSDMNSAKSVYAFSAASAGMIISSEDDVTDGDQGTQIPDDNQGTQIPDGNQGTQIPDDNQGTQIPDDNQGTQIPDDNQGTQIPDGDGGEATPSAPEKYMQLVDSLLSDGAYDITERPSDRAEYEFMTTISYRDMDGDAHSYTMYYDKFDYEAEKGEEEYDIRGVMTIEGVDYPITGERETESEHGEYENETEFSVDLGEGRRMIVEHSFESEKGEVEQEYTYALYTNGRLTEKTTFEYESEKGETEIEMTCVSDGRTQSFRFKSEKVRGEQVMILCTGERDRDRYIVRQHQGENGNYYTFEPLNG